MKKRIILCNSVASILNVSIQNDIIKHYEKNIAYNIDELRTCYYKLEFTENNICLYYNEDLVGTYNIERGLINYKFIVFLDNIVHYSMILI